MKFLEQMADQSAATEEVRYRGHGAYILQSHEFTRNSFPRTLLYCPFSQKSPQGAFIVSNNEVYFFHKDDQQVLRVGTFCYGTGEYIHPNEIKSLGNIRDVLKRTVQAQQARFLSDTTPENTRRPEKLEMIAAFRKAHNIDDETFNGIDVNQCWIFQNKLKEIAKILNISLEEELTLDRPAP